MAKHVSLPSRDDHLISFEVVPDDGGDPIEVTMPMLNYMPPRHVRDYREWAEQSTKLAEEHDKWAAKTGKKGPEPDLSEVPLAVYQFQLRYLKPYVSDGDWQRIWNDVSPGHAQDIFNALSGGDEEISEGESSASTDS